jgi:hypothetical protein
VDHARTVAIVVSGLVVIVIFVFVVVIIVVALFRLLDRAGTGILLPTPSHAKDAALYGVAILATQAQTNLSPSQFNRRAVTESARLPPEEQGGSYGLCRHSSELVRSNPACLD